MKYFTGATLIDGTDSPPLKDSVLAVDDGRIAEVGNADQVTVPPDAEEVDCRGLWLMPGLIDSHVHLQGTRTLEAAELIAQPPEIRLLRAAREMWMLIDAGYTTVRDCGEHNALFLKRAQQEGDLIGPRVLASGAMITQTAGHGDPAHEFPETWVKERRLTVMADGVDECRRAARSMIREGADFIKFCSSGGVLSDRDMPVLSQYSQEELNALVQEAHRFGKKASCHAHAAAGIRKALLAGVDTIEHGSLAEDDAIELMLEREVVMNPTLALGFSLLHQGASLGASPEYQRKVAQIRKAKIERLRVVMAAGVNLGCGSDFLGGPLCPQGMNALELILQQSEAGRESGDIIQSATRVNAKALGLGDELGTLEPGKRADFLLLEKDPLKDLGSLLGAENIRRIYQDGEPVPRMPKEMRPLMLSPKFLSIALEGGSLGLEE